MGWVEQHYKWFFFLLWVRAESCGAFCVCVPSYEGVAWVGKIFNRFVSDLFTQSGFRSWAQGTPWVSWNVSSTEKEKWGFWLVTFCSCTMIPRINCEGARCNQMDPSSNWIHYFALCIVELSLSYVCHTLYFHCIHTHTFTHTHTQLTHAWAFSLQ